MKIKFRFAAIVLAALCILGNAVPALAAEQPVNPFSFSQDRESADFVYNLYLQQGGVFTVMSNDPFTKAINALPKRAEAKTLSQEACVARIIKVELYNHYEKHIYELRPQELRFDGKGYKLTEKQYKDLCAAYENSLDKSSAKFAHWLVWMNPERVTKITFVDKTGKAEKTDTVSKENLFFISGDIRNMHIQGSPKRYDPKQTNIQKFAGGIYTNIVFDGKVEYRMFLDDKNMYIESSDIAYGYHYQNKDPKTAIQSYKDMIAMANAVVQNPLTAKPVIYLYPQTKTDVSVKLDFKGKLATTIPAYNGGWNVTAQPDGTITDKVDGKEYPYLFWDGNAYFNDWDFSSGFCVKAGESGEFLRKKLPELGLLPHEYNEFIAYWEPVLAQNNYNLITFATEQYEAVAPLAVTPAPDSVIRVHMVYKGLDKPINLPAQQLETPPARQGFTVVEWGGTRAR